MKNGEIKIETDMEHEIEVDEVGEGLNPHAQVCLQPVSYTHLTLPTKA